MSYKIYLRPLKVEDAKISYKWRNNPKVWRYTGSKPSHEITYEIEKKWIETKLNLNKEVRYAICLVRNNEYIGNVQLTDLKNKTAEFHIFIGNEKYWGKGIGKSATKKMLDIGFSQFNLQTIYLEVNENNISAVKTYEKMGFTITDKFDSIMHMSIHKNE